jgi:HAD superfamily hydrolase (TIGR01509 family)
MLPAYHATDIRALIFDFDGLILDTEGPDFRAWQEVFEEHGGDLPISVWCECIGRSADWFDPIAYLEDQTGTRLDRDAIVRRQRERHHVLVAAEAVLPGVEDYVTQAGALGLRLGIASSSSRRWVEGHLMRLGLETRWDCIHCWDDVERTKPEPDLYLAALRTLGVAAREAIAFEDSPNGVAAARAAGVYCVAVPNCLTQGLDLSGADLRLSSLAEIPLSDLLDGAAASA